MDRDLLRKRIAVIGRPALQNVGNVYLATGKSDRLHDFIQELPCPSHEGFARPVLICARCLTNHHQIGIRVTDPENRIRSSLIERSKNCVGYIVLQIRE